MSMICERYQRQVIARFIAALALIFRSGRVRPFAFRGLSNDKASDPVVGAFLEDKLRLRFTMFNLLFQKIPPSDDTRYVLYIAPQFPREDDQWRHPDIIPITVLPNQTSEWKKTTFPDRFWSREIDVSVKEDRSYYFRIIHRLDDETRDYLKLQGLGERECALLDHSKKRSRYYPYGLLVLLCHLENNVEKLDGLPRHRFHISQDVRTVLRTKFDLTRSEIEYEDMEWDPELVKRREEHLKARARRRRMTTRMRAR